MQGIIILVPIKTSSKNVIRKKTWNYWGCYYFLFEKKILKLLSSAIYSPSHCQAGTPVINTQSALRGAPDLCKHVPFIILFGSNGNPYTTSKQ
jgi:hypothetical protein